MSVPIVISIVLLFSIIGMVLRFYIENNTIGQLHEQTISELERAIYNNRSQISFRTSHLNRYDFQKYNLEEVLIVQPEIQI